MKRWSVSSGRFKVRPESPIFKMKERPIIFSGEMVRAILEGKKTQTRRIVKPVNGDFIFRDGKDALWDRKNKAWKPCPYGQPGDRLWVREPWRIYSWYPYELSVQFKNGEVKYCEATDENSDTFDKFFIESTDDCIKAGAVLNSDDEYEFEPKDLPTRWRSPIYMPRWASRITLEVTGVRVERLHDITENDAKAEGSIALTAVSECGGPSYRLGFSVLWLSIYGKAFWAENPWVRVIQFTKLSD